MIRWRSFGWIDDKTLASISNQTLIQRRQTVFVDLCSKLRRSSGSCPGPKKDLRSAL